MPKPDDRDEDESREEDRPSACVVEVFHSDVHCFGCYIMAVGGAGSLGSPALVSGQRIIKAASPTNTTVPARYKGSPKICGGCFGGAQTLARKPAHSRPMSASPAINPEAVRIPEFSTRAACAEFNRRRLATQSPRERMIPPTKMANVVANGRYMPTATSMGLRTCIMII